jgi:hypothetical protein
MRSPELWQSLNKISTLIECFMKLSRMIQNITKTSPSFTALQEKAWNRGYVYSTGHEVVWLQATS